jgi:phage-related protein (TIGR01555 family)
MFKWLKPKTEVPRETEKKAKKSLFSTHAFDMFDPDVKKFQVADALAELKRAQPALHGQGMDDSSNGLSSFKTYDNGINTVSDAVIGWYASQGFIGAQLCGILAQNWLVNKACSMPAEDAIRKGYDIVTTDGDELDPKALKIIKAYDKSLKLQSNMREFIRNGRIFGIRIAMFKVQSTDPQYYEKPFNIDGITPNSYKGILQVDPYWTAPMLDNASSSQPDTLHFYEPTWWLINGKKVHRSHLIVFRHAEPVDILKPQYIYGGVPLTQQIMERVYAAERTANEAPQLAMSKRTTVWYTDMEAVMSDTSAAMGRLQQWASYRDNYGIKLGDKEGDQFQQFDTAVGDMDSLIDSQYQLVASIAGVPATKLLGTSPRGFGASGDYEEASYHELLESLQTNDLTPLIERHHALVIKSYVEPQLGIKMDVETTVHWLPLDTPKAQDLAATNLIKAQIDQALLTAGAISSEDIRQRIATSKDSGYNELGNDKDLDPFEQEFLKENEAIEKQAKTKLGEVQNNAKGK